MIIVAAFLKSIQHRSFTCELTMSIFSLETRAPLTSVKPTTLLPLQLSFTIPFIKPASPHLYSRSRSRNFNSIVCCSNADSISPPRPTTTINAPPPVVKKKMRHRKLLPGEKKGITEEMRFATMKLRNIKGKYTHKKTTTATEAEERSEKEGDQVEDGDQEGWVPSMEGFVKFLVDSKLVFDTVEGIVDRSEDVSYAYFRRTGLERSESLAMDLEWLSGQGIVIPEASNPGVTYVKYLEELAKSSPHLFLCHFYNIYFAHIAGGQVISRQVSDRLLEGREMEFYRWDGDVQELLRGVREKLNMLGEHWTRDDKNKCLKEVTKAFKYLGQIVRLIIL